MAVFMRNGRGEVGRITDCCSLCHLKLCEHNFSSHRADSVPSPTQQEECVRATSVTGMVLRTETLDSWLIIITCT